MPDPQADVFERIRAFNREGDFLGAFDAASSGLREHPSETALAYELVLAMARSGATEAARRAYDERLAGVAIADSRLHLDVAALDARLEKDRARASRGEERTRALTRSYERYARLADEAGDPYPAVNAATLALARGDPDAARAYARMALERAASAGPYWSDAIVAESSLVLGDEKTAADAIRSASASNDLAARASTLRQLTEIARMRGIDESVLDPLRPPSTVHFTGNRFAPDERTETIVRDELGRHFGAEKVGFGFGSLAAGADIVIAETLLARGAQLHVVLPFDLDEFVHVSVRAAGEPWVARFRACFDAAASVRYATSDAYLGDDVLFRYAGRIAMGTALLHAERIGGTARQIAAWNGVRSGGIAGTSADVGAWSETGAKAHSILISPEPLEKSDTAVRDTPERVMRAMLFGDVHNFSKLRESVLPAFNDVVLAGYARVFARFGDRVESANTWGDGLHAAFVDADTAAACALLLQDEMLSLESAAFPRALELRLGVHFGPVFPVVDPVTHRRNFMGDHVNRTARIEPSTPEGTVYVTEAFAAELALTRPWAYRCDYAGNVKAAKDYGTLPMYALRAG